MTIRLITLTTLVACNGIKAHPALPPDAPPDQMIAIDAPIDTAAMLAAHHYIIDKQIFATTNAEAVQDGLDLNNDGVVDNQLGMVLATFAAQGFDKIVGFGSLQAAVDGFVDHGGILMLVDVESNNFVTGPATFTLFTGTDPVPPACNGTSDTTCRHHLDGNGSFTVSTSSARDTPLAGSFAGGTLVTDAGTGHLHLQTLPMSNAVIDFDLVGARIKLTEVGANGIMSGIIGGGVTQADIDNQLIPAWKQQFHVDVLDDCTEVPPDCGCTNGSIGKTLIGLFDTDHDCSITATEIENNNLTKSLLAPDVTIGGQQLVSFGIAFTAVDATFTP